MDFVDNIVLANSLFRRREFDRCIEVCGDILQKNPLDQAAWLLKCRALTSKSFVDDMDWVEDGGVEALLENNSTALAPKAGTSLRRPGTSSTNNVMESIMRPRTAAGRAATGFARPGSSVRATGIGGMESAFRGHNPGTSRIMTAANRATRISTALANANSKTNILFDTGRYDLSKYACQRSLGRALCEYLLYVEGNARRALDLCSLALNPSNKANSSVHTAATKSPPVANSTSVRDWWWMMMSGLSSYKLGLDRDGLQSLLESITVYPSTENILSVSRIYSKMDVPHNSIETLNAGARILTDPEPFLVALARIYSALNDSVQSNAVIGKVLRLNPLNIEALSTLASNNFYSDAPETALKAYMRLLQLGLTLPEVWNNIGLCSALSGQFDFTIGSLLHAVSICETVELRSDVWYNLGCVLQSVGDTNLALQCLEISLHLNPDNVESRVNLGVILLRQGRLVAAASEFAAARRAGDLMIEPWYNGALASLRLGDYQEAFRLVTRALELDPENIQCTQLKSSIERTFAQI